MTREDGLAVPAPTVPPAPQENPDLVVVLDYGSDVGAHGRTGPGRDCVTVAALPIEGTTEGGMYRLLAELAHAEPDAVVLLHHDDVTLGPAAAPLLAAAVRGGATYAVPFTNDTGTDHSIGSLPVDPTPEVLGRFERQCGPAGRIEAISTFRPSCLAARAADLIDLVARRPHDPLSLMTDVVGDTVAVRGAVAAHANDCVARLRRLGETASGQVLVANLIVRDEEDNVEACLDSLGGVVDRVEVADTGSVDRTLELLDRAGITPLHRTWRDDFGWARNEVLEVSRDADWILWVDADERATAADPVLLRGYLHAFAAELDVMELYVHNVNDFDESDAFLAPRLLNARNISFEGRLHERPVRRADSSLDLRHAPCGLIELHHYGYQASAVSAKGKAARNLEVARTAYERHRSAKNALDLARSLTVNPGSDPDEITELYREGMAGIAPHSHRELAWVRGLLGSHLLATIDDPEAALAEAQLGIDLVPEDWGCRAVGAAALNRLGRGAELVEMDRRLSDQRSLRPMTRGRAFRARYLRELAAAELEGGDVEAAWLSCTGAAEHGGYQTHDEVAMVLAVAEARRGDEIDHLVEAVALGPAANDRLAVVGAVAASRPHATAAEVVRRLGALMPLDPDVTVVGVVVDAASGGDGSGLLHHVEALDTTRRAAVEERLTRMGRVDLVRQITPTLDLRGDDLDGAGRIDPIPPIDPDPSIDDVAVTASDWGLGPRLAVDLRRVGLPPDGLRDRPELVVLDRAGASGEVWRELRRSIDPAGVVIAVDGVEPPVGPTPEWFLERVSGPDRVLRPIWTHDDLDRAAARLVEPGVAEIVVAVEGSVTPALQAAVRCSIPASRPVAVVELDATTASAPVPASDGQVVLIVPGDVVPEPGWIQLLLDEAARGVVVGCPLVTASAEVVHVGALVDGRAVGAGMSVSANPLLDTDADRLVLPPCAGPGPLVRSGGVPGRVLGGALAVADRDDPGTSSARLHEIVGDAAVVVCDDDHRRRTVVTEIVAAGRTPVVWSRSDASMERSQGLAGLGALLFGHADATTAPVRCTLGQLVGAVRPLALVTDDPVSVAEDYDAVARAGVDATVVWVGDTPPPQPDRIDLVRVAGGLGDALDRRSWPDHVRRVPTIEPVTALAETDADGVVATTPVVSIVIPVHGQIDLTLACLDAVRATIGSTPVELIVVDDASPDDTAARLAGTNDVRVVSNPVNLGFPGAVNRGIEASRGELVCLLNNDTEPAAGWLDELLATLDQPGTELVAPRSNRIFGCQRVADAPSLGDSGAAHAWAAGFHRRHRGTSFETLNAKGMCLLARRELFERLGGLDEGFGPGNGEDDELCNRVLAAGGRIRIANGSVVLHHGSATFRDIDIDYGTLLRLANRQLSRRNDAAAAADRRGLTGAVLSSGDVAGVMVTVEALWAFVDRIVVIESGPLPLTELAMGANPAEVSVRAAAWPTERVAALSGLPGEALLILRAGEVPEADDPGAARTRLDRVRATGGRIRTERGPSARLLAITPQGRLLDPGPDVVAGLSITS